MARTSSNIRNDLFKRLGIGTKKENRGVLLLVAPTDRKSRVEVGYGLEPVINDARAGDAGRLMRSYFLQGNYSAGIEDRCMAARQIHHRRSRCDAHRNASSSIRSARARTTPGLSPSGRFLFSFSS